MFIVCSFFLCTVFPPSLKFTYPPGLQLRGISWLSFMWPWTLTFWSGNWTVTASYKWNEDRRPRVQRWFTIIIYRLIPITIKFNARLSNAPTVRPTLSIQSCRSVHIKPMEQSIPMSAPSLIPPPLLLSFPSPDRLGGSALANRGSGSCGFQWFWNIWNTNLNVNSCGVPANCFIASSFDCL